MSVCVRGRSRYRRGRVCGGETACGLFCVFVAGQCGEDGHLFDLLIVDHNVSALLVVEIGGGRASVLDGYFFHVLSFFGREAIEGDA